MLEPVIGKIWYLTKEQAVKLGIDGFDDTQVYQSQCGRYWYGTHNSLGLSYSIGNALPSTSEHGYLKVGDIEKAGADSWKIICAALAHNRLGLPSEILVAGTPPYTLTQSREQRFTLVIRDM